MRRPNLPSFVLTIPLGMQSRKPLTKYPLDAQGEERAWGSVTGRAGTGILCGPSGLLVLDLDINHDDGNNGAKSLVEYLKNTKGMSDEEARRVIKDAPVLCRTRRGGLQLYYLRPDGVNGTTVGILPGCDTRGVQGMAVIPPTAGYRWMCFDWDRIVEAPAWLVELVIARETGKPDTRMTPNRGHAPDSGVTERPDRFTIITADDGTKGTAAEILVALPGNKIEVFCQAHDDDTPSAVIYRPVGRGRINLHCRTCMKTWAVGRLA